MGGWLDAAGEEATSNTSDRLEEGDGESGGDVLPAKPRTPPSDKEEADGVSNMLCAVLSLTENRGVVGCLCWC